MYRRTILIESKPQREGQKSRAFSVELLAWVLANPLWELGGTAKERVYRPAFLAFAGTSSPRAPLSPICNADVLPSRGAKGTDSGSRSLVPPASATSRSASPPAP